MEQLNYYFLDTIKKRYADFNGKATRSEYWYFVLFYIIIASVLAVVDTFVVNPMRGMTTEQARQGGILQMIFSLGLLVPFIAVGVRRLHDIGKSGWIMLMGLIPLFGGLILIYFFMQKSK